MGLDATVYAVKGTEKKEIEYFRNHGSLNWAMHVIAFGENPVESNHYHSLSYVGLVTTIYLEDRNLDQIEQCVPHFEYDPGGGFPNSPEKDLLFLKKARHFRSLGYEIAYDSC